MSSVSPLSLASVAPVVPEMVSLLSSTNSIADVNTSPAPTTTLAPPTATSNKTTHIPIVPRKIMTFNMADDFVTSTTPKSMLFIGGKLSGKTESMKHIVNMVSADVEVFVYTPCLNGWSSRVNHIVRPIESLSHFEAIMMAERKIDDDASVISDSGANPLKKRGRNLLVVDDYYDYDAPVISRLLQEQHPYKLSIMLSGRAVNHCLSIDQFDYACHMNELKSHAESRSSDHRDALIYVTAKHVAVKEYVYRFHKPMSVTNESKSDIIPLEPKEDETEVEPILRENKSRFVLFPIKYDA